MICQKIRYRFESLEFKIEMVKLDEIPTVNDFIEGVRYIPSKKRRMMTEEEKEIAVKEIEGKRADYISLSKVQRKLLENINIKKQ